jgi:hypothetical protein
MPLVMTSLPQREIDGLHVKEKAPLRNRDTASTKFAFIKSVDRLDQLCSLDVIGYSREDAAFHGFDPGTQVFGT